MPTKNLTKIAQERITKAVNQPSTPKSKLPVRNPPKPVPKPKPRDPLEPKPYYPPGRGISKNKPTPVKFDSFKPKRGKFQPQKFNLTKLKLKRAAAAQLKKLELQQQRKRRMKRKIKRSVNNALNQGISRGSVHDTHPISKPKPKSKHPYKGDYTPIDPKNPVGWLKGKKK